MFAEIAYHYSADKKEVQVVHHHFPRSTRAVWVVIWINQTMVGPAGTAAYASREEAVAHAERIAARAPDAKKPELPISPAVGDVIQARLPSSPTNHRVIGEVLSIHPDMGPTGTFFIRVISCTKPGLMQKHDWKLYVNQRGATMIRKTPATDDEREAAARAAEAAGSAIDRLDV